jgi:hypothetical protein
VAAIVLAVVLLAVVESGLPEELSDLVGFASGALAAGSITRSVAAWLSIVYLGDHYVIDVIGGVAYACAALVLLAEWRRRRSTSRVRSSSAGTVATGTT